MQNLRNAKLIARFVLVWFALSIGVAIASPMVKPQGMQLVCSGAGAMKVIVAGENGTQPATSHTLDCPLCASISAPPPLAAMVLGGVVTRTFDVPRADTSPLLFISAAPPPARGPPALS